MKVILISGKARHGKDTLAGMMKEELEGKGKRVLIAHYADLLKFICKNFFGWNGEKDDNGRALLQRVGTDVIRKQNPDYWVGFMISILKLFPDEWDYVIIPDTRFPNEIETIKNAGLDFVHIRIERPNFKSPLTEAQQKHISETALDGYPCHIYVGNGGTLEELRNGVTKIINTSQYIQDGEK